MAQGTVHVDESGAVPKIDISIINEKSVAVSIFRLDPNTFEEEPVVELGSGETKTVTLWVTDCLVAKIGAEVVGEFGVCEDLREWRVPVATPRMASIVGSWLKIIVQNRCGFKRANANLFRFAISPDLAFRCRFVDGMESACTFNAG